MQFNYYFLKLLTKDLKPHLIGKLLTSCFSQNKNELILGFEDKKTSFHIKVNLDSEYSALSFPDKFARAKKNSIDLFPGLNQKKVSDIRLFENERSFSIEFGALSLLFKLHGRRGNIIQYELGEFRTMFKNDMPKDQSLDLDKLDRPIDQREKNWLKENFNLTALFPTFDKTIYHHLEYRGFSQLENDMKASLLKELLDELHEPTIYLYKNQIPPKISLIQHETNEYPDVYHNSLEASNAFARSLLIEHQFHKEKSETRKKVQKEITKTKNYLKKTSSHIHSLESSRKYDEIANILMANLHETIRPDQKTIKLFDFYENEPIDIKIKAHQSLQQTAQDYYRKSKNQSIELNKAKENLRKKEVHLTLLNHELDEISMIQNLKELRSFVKPSHHKKDAQPLPFTQVILEGYEILIGRNAKNNDLLTQKYARKNDLWLHAKDVSGSHVLIRSSNNLQFPKSVIERAAEIAAWYSKRKNDSICPVIYTEKKYVRKPKGSLPGQVVVDREQVILVTPKGFSS